MELRNKLDSLTREAAAAGSSADYLLDIMLYSPNPGQVSFIKGTAGYKAFEDYSGAMGRLRECQIPTRVLCFTDGAIGRMVSRLSTSDDERAAKVNQTAEFIKWLESSVQQHGGPGSVQSAVSVWRHGRVPNSHFFCGGHEHSAKWVVRFLIRREANGTGHQVSGSGTEDSVEISFAREIFAEYLREVASPLETQSLQLNGETLTFEIDFYAQSNVGSLKIYAQTVPRFESDSNSLLVEIVFDSLPSAGITFESMNRTSISEEYADVMKIKGNVECARTLQSGKYYLRGEFIKKHNGSTSGISEVWMQQLEVQTTTRATVQS